MHLKTTTRRCSRKSPFDRARHLRICVADALPIPSDESAAPPGHARCTSGNEKAASSFEATGTVQPLNSIQKTVKPLNSSTVKQRRLSWQEENDLLTEIKTQFVRAHGANEAKAEMSRSGAFWRKICRHFPDELERAVGELKHRLNVGDGFRTRAWFWLSKEVLIYIGADNWPSAWENF